MNEVVDMSEDRIQSTRQMLYPDPEKMILGVFINPRSGKLFYAVPMGTERNLLVVDNVRVTEDGLIEVSVDRRELKYRNTQNGANDDK